MSGYAEIPSPFLSQNELYYPQFANQQLAQNQLAMQEKQQSIGAN